jgi:hypothetical protein
VNIERSTLVFELSTFKQAEKRRYSSSFVEQQQHNWIILSLFRFLNLSIIFFSTKNSQKSFCFFVMLQKQNSILTLANFSNAMTFQMTKLSIMKLTKMTFSIMALSKMTLSKKHSAK